jgi:hypothetical protein
MKQVLAIIIVFLFLGDTYPQIVGRYWGGVARLELNSDSTYIYYKGACVAYYSEGGTYSLKKDTLLFSRKDSCCIYCTNVDSTAYYLNENNLFDMKFYKVQRCEKHWDETDQLPRTLFYQDHRLYTRKSQTRPHFSEKDFVFTNLQEEVPDFKKLESDALLKLLSQEYNY